MRQLLCFCACRLFAQHFVHQRLHFVIQKEILEHGEQVEAQQDELRSAIATIALPDKNELAKLGKYRSMLELSLGRRLGALEQMRKITAGNVVDEKDVVKAREYRVKLRVVA